MFVITVSKALGSKSQSCLLSSPLRLHFSKADLHCLQCRVDIPSQMFFTRKECSVFLLWVWMTLYRPCRSLS